MRLQDIPAGAIVNYNGRDYEWTGFPPKDYGHDRVLIYPVNAPAEGYWAQTNGGFAVVVGTELRLDYASAVEVGRGAHVGKLLISDPAWSGWASD